MPTSENANATAVTNEDMELGFFYALSDEILPDTDMFVNDWFFRMFDLPACETGYDPDLTLFGVEDFYSKHRGVPMPKTGYASRYPMYTTVLLMTVLLRKKQITLYQWYTFCFPTRITTINLNPRISVNGLFNAIRTGANIFDYIGENDYTVLCRLFCAASAMTGYHYDVIYRLWLTGTGKKPAV